MVVVSSQKASSVFVHRVPEACVERFLVWQRGVSEAVKNFPGYQSTDVFPPDEQRPEEWLIVAHFDNGVALQRWLDSPERAAWTDKLPLEVKDYQLTKLPSGFGAWFQSTPANWKMALSVLLGLFPIVMLLTIVVGPFTSRYGLTWSMLIGNALSVSILQWIVMPPLTRALAPWLNAVASKRAKNIYGALGVIALIVLIAFIFHLWVG